MSEKESPDYVRYDPSDDDYGGAKGIINKELDYILAKRGLESQCRNEVKKSLSGLALSGGGIRSSTFALGVLQALAEKGYLRHFDYLSTVSGGGYIGSSLTWLLGRYWKRQDPKTGKEERVEFGLDPENFPYRVFPPPSSDHSKSHREGDSGSGRALSAGAAVSNDKKREDYSRYIVRFLRQHAKYLTPGDGISFASMVAVVVRGMLLCLLFYLPLLTLASILLNRVKLFSIQKEFLAGSESFPLENWIIVLVLAFMTLWLAWVSYKYLLKRSTSVQDSDSVKKNVIIRVAQKLSPTAVILFVWFVAVKSQIPIYRGWAFTPIPTSYYFSEALKVAAFGFTMFILSAIIYSIVAYCSSKQEEPDMEGWWYECCRVYEMFAGNLLITILLFTLIGILPHVSTWLQNTSLLSNMFGNSDGKPLVFGAISSLLGALSGFLAFLKSTRKKEGWIPIRWLAVAGSFLLLFGFLLLAYVISDYVISPKLVDSDNQWFWFGGFLLFLLFFGGFTNLNYFSIHRYYRDRLMETFMPDVPSVLQGKETEAIASPEADRGYLKEYCRLPQDDTGNPGGTRAQNNSRMGPYHIINTNLILLSSHIPKFRGRGGDNFILSPRWCGSNATGWLATGKFMDGKMTLSTAMAISGAAINPNAGSGGSGPTRSRFLSMLMGLLNLRLGYWVRNPNPEVFQTSKSPTGNKPVNKSIPKLNPNFLWPGLSELFFRANLSEQSWFIQLSDGGHFENMGLYEMVRRKLRLIVLCDGTADPDLHFKGLSEAIEKVRVDFGAKIKIESECLRPVVPHAPIDDRIKDKDKVHCADRSYIVADIEYVDGRKGKLIYLNTTFTPHLGVDLYGYKLAHPEFPDETTANQFFDERQFEAYRELGFQTTLQMMDDPDALKALKEGLQLPTTQDMSGNYSVEFSTDEMVLYFSTLYF